MPYDLTNFNAELSAVDPARVFTQTINPTWGENEWAVSGYSITAGSDAAVQHGASEALYQLGYRYWSPQKTTRPNTLPAGGVSLSRQTFSYPHVLMFFNYGFGGGDNGGLQTRYNAWTEFMAFNDSRRPVGHAYPGIINAIEAEDGFFTTNPSYIIGTPNVGQPSFNLDLTGSDYDALVTRVAQHITPRLNAQNRHSIDPNDGSTWTSDQVFTFANNVVDEIRQTNSDAMLGLYGYAGHRQPVTFQCPHLYVDLARGFNDLGIGYLAIGKLWSQVVPEFGLRCYGDIAAWQGWSRHIPANYLEDFAEHAEDGAIGISMETSGNWTKNVIAKQHWMRHWRGGTTTYQDVLSDAVEKLYEGDARVADLFLYWSGLGTKTGPYAFRPAAEIVAAMPDTEYRAEFERYLTFVMQDDKLHDRVDQHTPSYFTGLERNLRATAAIEASGEIHHYAYARQRANANTLNNGRPDLSLDQQPHWGRFSSIYDRSDFTLAFEENKAITGRPVELEDERLVVINTQPWPGASVSEARGFFTLGFASFVFAGPGTVTVSYDNQSNTSEVLNFGRGLHEFMINGEATTTWTDGMLFLSIFPEARLDPLIGGENTGRDRWIYVPKIAKGIVDLSSKTRIRIRDQQGIKNISEARPPFDPGSDDPRQIQQGIVEVDNVNTRGIHRAGNINPYVSPTPYKMLMPFNLARKEFPNIVFNGQGAIPDVIDLSDETDGLSDQTEV